MIKSNLNGNIHQTLEYLNNQLKKYESEKKTYLEKNNFSKFFGDYKEIKK